MDIPKKIHYCWFGNNLLDEKALKCIESWRKFFPGYEIIQWNESNFDVSQMDFIKKAYEEKKWAFVSDVARLLVVYENGGIYFDTDVEVVAPYDDILSECKEGFFGMEKSGHVNSGLGFGAVKGHWFLKQLLDKYEELDFDIYKNNLQDIACPIIQTNLMIEKGFEMKDKKQMVCDFTIYPSDYFSPLEYYTGKLKKTSDTHSIHWYSASWFSKEENKNLKTFQKYRRIFGKKFGDIICGIVLSIKKEGLFNYIRKKIQKVNNNS